MKLICKTAGNVEIDTLIGKYDHDILIRLDLRTNKMHALHTQEICVTP